MESTIKNAIIAALKFAGKPLTAEQIYEIIAERQFYQFNSNTPIAIVQSTLRKNTVGIELKKSNNVKVFKMDNSKFTLII